MRKNIRVTTALSAILALFVVLFALAAAGAITVLRENRADIEALGRGSIERAGDLADMTSRLFQARAALTDAKTAMEGGLEEARNESLAHAEALLKQAGESLGRLRANPDISAEGAPLFDGVLAAYAAFADKTLAPMHAAIKGWNGIEVNRLVDKTLPASGAAYVKQADAYQTYARDQGQAAVASASLTLQRVIAVAAGVLALVLLLAVLIRLAFRRSILRPLNEAGAHFDRIADGDLTGAIAMRGDNEIGVLYSAMRRMQKGLSAAVASVRHGVEEIHTGSGEIAAGGADMSDRTARQAGSLQEASANMMQLAQTVQLTAGNADLASRQALGATQLAQRGGAAVEEVVQSMQGIAESARRIGEIVGVVDSIAFQTNILALNAAVEAARAGAGKGLCRGGGRGALARPAQRAGRQGNQGPDRGLRGARGGGRASGQRGRRHHARHDAIGGPGHADRGRDFQRDGRAGGGHRLGEPCGGGHRTLDAGERRHGGADRGRCRRAGSPGAGSAPGRGGVPDRPAGRWRGRAGFSYPAAAGCRRCSARPPATGSRA